MPSSVWAAHTGIAVIGGIAFLALFAGLLTPVVSALLLAAYRARIGRLMASRSGPEAERAQASRRTLWSASSGTARAVPGRRPPRRHCQPTQRWAPRRPRKGFGAP